jgi:hypothetical protein
LFVAAAAVAFAVSAPAWLPDTGKASAQISGCSCYAAFDAIDSDLRNIGRYQKSTVLGAPAGGCASACNAWRREWFSRDACDKPTRINRGIRASWGFEAARTETFVGPDTWWCPFPPP